jgi:uncharacterized membrane protein
VIKVSRWVWLIAFVQLAIHLVFSTRGYGFFGDELYYMACAEHLAFGYVDHPPFSIWLLAAWQGLLGDSLFALRLLPALFGAAAVLLTGALTAEFGGRERAQSLAAVVIALAPVNLVVTGYYSMNAIDIAVWALAFLLVARVLRSPSRGGWVGLGVVLGIGLLNKISVLWFGSGLFVGLLLTPHRQVLLTRGPWLAGAIAAVLFLPHVFWQIAYEWPTAEFMVVATSQKMVPVSPLDLFAQQILVWNPLALPLWIAGLIVLIWRPPTNTGWVFASIFIVTAIILMINGTSRPNYLALAVPPLVAAGAVVAEQLGERRRWLMPTAIGLIGYVGLAGSPLAIPILSPERLIAYQEAIGISAPRMENQQQSSLDQHFADMIGWQELVDTVAEVYHALPADERDRVAIMGPSYNTTGAIDLFGPALGLPPAISGHNSYWYWGHGGADGSIVLLVGGSQAYWLRYWGSVEPAAVWECRYCMPARNGKAVFIAREPRAPLAEMWSDLRHFD